MNKPRLLDLFCGAGGCAAGYVRAGFDVTGVDVKEQPRYPFAFVQADALEYLAKHGHEYDAIHASPPCHAYVQWAGINRERNGGVPDHPDLVAATREALEASGKPWVIENVVGSPMRRPLILCGSMFRLGVRRHRLFESSALLMSSMRCAHTREELAIYGKLDGRRVWTRTDGTEARAARTIEQARAAMGIDWMEWGEITQAIPPAYCEFVGRQLLAAIENGRAA